MEICGHCHNVLPKTVDKCTVCGTARVDPTGADVRRREDGNLPSHAPGWAAPVVPNDGIHPDDFLRQLAGQEPSVPNTAASEAASPAAVLPPRSVPKTPAPGALAGYLGTTVDRRPKDPAAAAAPPPASTSTPTSQTPLHFDAAPTPPMVFAQHLSTATRVAPDGVAARTTRLDGTVKLGPTSSHRVLTLGAPLLAGLLLVGGVLGSYRIRSSQAQEVEAAAQALELDASAIAASSEAVVDLDLDGCGILDQTRGMLFADNTILVPKTSIVTDNRPSVRTADGATHSAEVLGWSLTRNLAVVRTEERLTGGLEWGVSARVSVDDVVSVLSFTGGNSPIPATIATTNTVNGRNASFELDIPATEGSVVLNAEGFVIGVMDDKNLAQASEDIAPAVSRLVLANERPRAVCPAPPTTDPVDGSTGNEAEENEPDQ